VKHTPSEGISAWESVVERAKIKGWNFKQAKMMFFKWFGYWPQSNWPLMPKDPLDLGRRVRCVSRSKLTGLPSDEPHDYGLDEITGEPPPDQRGDAWEHPLDRLNQENRR
jgi:hypothetical protein